MSLDWYYEVCEQAAWAEDDIRTKKIARFHEYFYPVRVRKLLDVVRAAEIVRLEFSGRETTDSIDGLLTALDAFEREGT